MKRYILVPISFIAFLYLLSFPLVAQDPDAWEEYQTSLQPPETVIPAIDLKEGMTPTTTLAIRLNC